MKYNYFSQTITEPSPLNIIPRDEWGALEPKAVRKQPLPVPSVAEYLNLKVEPCNNKMECSERAREVQKRSMEEEGRSDVRYNFLIGGDGNVYEGRGWDVYATDNHDWPGISIGFLGNYGIENMPKQETMDLMFKLIEFGKKENYLKTPYYFHWCMDKGRQRSYYN